MFKRRFVTALVLAVHIYIYIYTSFEKCRQLIVHIDFPTQKNTKNTEKQSFDLFIRDDNNQIHSNTIEVLKYSFKS